MIFKKKTDVVNRFGALENPHIEVSIENRPSFEKSTKIDVRQNRIDRFDTKFRFLGKMNVANRFSALENLHIEVSIENRPSFEKSIKIDLFDKVESIVSTLKIDIEQKLMSPIDSVPPKSPVFQFSAKLSKACGNLAN